MYEIMICPLKQLYRYAMDGDMTDVAVLAVSSYGVDKDRLKGFSRLLCLAFADVTDSANPSAFSKDIAKKIAQYIKKLPKGLDTLFVCCDSGESRSTAMAAAILRYKGLDDMIIWKNPHYHPNALVYELLCVALGTNVTEDEIGERVRINELAFARSIKNF